MSWRTSSLCSQFFLMQPSIILLYLLFKAFIAIAFTLKVIISDFTFYIRYWHLILEISIRDFMYTFVSQVKIRLLPINKVSIRDT